LRTLVMWYVGAGGAWSTMGKWVGDSGESLRTILYATQAMSEADCFEVVARSSEFENVQARDEENQELVKLLTNCCPIKIKCQAIEGEGIVIDQVWS